MKFKQILFLLVLLSALIVAAGCSKPLAGQAVAGFSDNGCVQGEWFYEVNGQVIGEGRGGFIGCTEYASENQPWCALTTVEKDGKQVYVSGGQMDIDWKYCSKEEVAQEEVQEEALAGQASERSQRGGRDSTEEQGSSEEEMAAEGTGYGGNEPVPCSDSDGGKDFLIKGTLTNPDGEVYEDFCSWGDVTSAGAGVKKDSSEYVYEYYCMDSGKAGTVIEKCSGGCKDGKGSGVCGGGGKSASASYINSWKVETSSNKLELANSNTTSSSINGEEVRDIVAFVGKKEISELGDGTWFTNEQKYGYKQYLFFDQVPGTTRSRIVKYVENDNDEVGDHFYIGNAKQIARYKLEFDTSAKSDITDEFGSADAKGKYLYDFENTELTLFGKKYTVVQATRPATNPMDSIKLVLMQGAAKDTILESETKSYTVGDKSYEVTLSYISPSEAKFIINGEATMKLKIGETYVLKDKSQVVVSEILYQAYAGGVHAATFFVGPQIMELRDDNVADKKGSYNVKVDSENIDGTTVIITGSDSFDPLIKTLSSAGDFSINTIEVNMVADDDIFVGAGSKLSDSIAASGGEKEILFTNNWDFEYKGLAEQKTHEITLKPLKPEDKTNYVLTLFEGNDYIQYAVAQSAGDWSGLVLLSGLPNELSDSYGSKWTITDKTKTSGTIVLTQTTPNSDDYDNVKPSDIVITISALNKEVRAKLEGPIGPNAGMVLLTPDGKTDVSHGYTSMGTFVTYTQPADDPQEVTLLYPEKQKLPQLYIVSGKK